MVHRPVTVLTGSLDTGEIWFVNKITAKADFGDAAIIVNKFDEAGGRCLCRAGG
ncbi:MAG: hypothetical protein AAF367_16190 [Pseudomonadota bacterium]